MPFEVVKDYPRLWSLNTGIAMVVTDLHGDWEIYQRYRDQFVELQTKGQADVLIFTGDLIHADDDNLPDDSLSIVLDVFELRKKYGEAIIYLCGNHELPHIYGFRLAKGGKEYTPSFEKMMSQQNVRPGVIEFFTTLPFYIRTTAGISLTHAGATLFNSRQQANKIFFWNHKEVLSDATMKLEQQDISSFRRAYTKLCQAETYEELAKHYLSVRDADDPRYNDLLKGYFVTTSDGFDKLRSTLFTRCEHEYETDTYKKNLEALLDYLSFDYVTQKVLVSGHIAVKNGYQKVVDKQLRLASGTHAKPQKSGKYLLFNTAKEIESVNELMVGLNSIYQAI